MRAWGAVHRKQIYCDGRRPVSRFWGPGPTNPTRPKITPEKRPLRLEPLKSAPSRDSSRHADYQGTDPLRITCPALTISRICTDRGACPPIPTSSIVRLRIPPMLDT